MLTPLRDKIVVRPIVRQASAVVATVLYERPNIGEVVAVGSGRYLKSGKLQPMELKVGDKIRFGEFAFDEYREDGVKYLIMQEADAAGVVEADNGICIRPLHDRVIVKRLDQETKTASGLIIPDAAAEKPDQGQILAVGNGKILDDGKVRPLDVKVGDRVLFGKYSGQTVKVDGEELLVMREEDCASIVDEVKA